MEGSPQFRPIDSGRMSAQTKDQFETEMPRAGNLLCANHHLMEGQQMQTFLKTTQRRAWWLVCLCLLLVTGIATAQTDQGAITGTVTDNTGAIVPGAQVTLSATDTGLTLQSKSNGSGNFTFSPIKIGNYSVNASAPGFQTTTRQNIHVDVQQRLQVNLALTPGQVSQTVTVTGAVELLQTQSSAVGQVIDTKTINDTPLNGRNWVYIAQLTAGVAPPFGNTRGSGTGDFVANGQRAEQNNFILDGVDNNTNLVDFLNGSSFVMRPPPDALAEFNLQTSNFSAEFGHSAGAVMNASIKSGTNQIHGDVWEYFRNTNLDATNWNALTVPPYHQNQFGATLGFPIWKNKLFYFGDIEANRISIGQTNVLSVPTALERQGNFSELLNTNLTGQSQPVTLYQPNSGDPTRPLACNGKANVFCANQINPVAQKILNMYPAPNANGGKTYSNLVENVSKDDDTIQWDQRLDWNISAKDQTYARYSYLHDIILNALPLGPVLDGSGYGGEQDFIFSQNFMLSETHIFTPTLTNEFRFGYNWNHSAFKQPNADNPTIASSLGLGGVPNLGPGQYGLPLGYFPNGEIQQWGSVGTNNETQNVYQILDNVTKILGNHSLKFGVSFQSVRFSYLYAPASLGQYYFNGQFTGVPGQSFTGSGVADFLANQSNFADIANAPNIRDAQWYDSAYAEDDWKVNPKLTLNLGVRYDYYQPYKEISGQQGNFITTGPLGIGTGSGIYQLPTKAKNVDLGASFLSTLAKDNVSVQYSDNERLANAQNTNFAPRVGFAYQAHPNTVIRGGYGIFYGGLMAQGNTNIGANFPFSNSANFYAPTCSVGNCTSLAGSNGITLETGLSPQISGGFQNFVSFPGFHATDVDIKTPYTMNYSMSLQQALSNNMAATLSYVGNVSRHLTLYGAPNTPPGLFAPGSNTQQYQPFPDLGGIGQIHYAGVSTYNSLQAKIEKRYSHGLSFLTSYTWAHALDDASDAAGNFTAIGDRNLALIPFIDEFTNSVFDVRQRFTFNGNYELPFGRGKAFLHESRLVDETIGGWSSSLTFAAQTGTPFTVSPNISTAANGSARAIPVRDPFGAGGSPDPSNPDVTCAPKTRTKANWYNPCAFANPLPGNLIGTAGYPSVITDQQSAIAFLGGRSNNVYGPGYYQVNMSLFKNFPTWREQYLQFRADGFNVLNHPTLANPSTTNNNDNGGNITGPKTFQNNTPDARFFQLSLKYAF
jgi:Carboxypeptidase regulatory-like domain/TonB dependent receptor-like, beta-barrel